MLWVQKHYPRLLMAKDNNQATIVHHAAQKPRMFENMLLHMPHLVKELWQKESLWRYSRRMGQRSISKRIITAVFIKANEKTIRP